VVGGEPALRRFQLPTIQDDCRKSRRAALPGSAGLEKQKSIHRHPIEKPKKLQKKHWLTELNLPQGRHEKQNS
jgi:hypothetical protein